MNIQDKFLGNKRESEFKYELNKNRKEKNEDNYKQKLKEKKKKKKKDKKGNKNKENNDKEYLIKLLNDESKKNTDNILKLEYQPIEDIEIEKPFKEKNKKSNNKEIDSEMQKVLDLFEKKIENQNKKIESLTKEKQPNAPKEKIQKENIKNSDDDSSSESDKELKFEESRKKRKKIIKEQGQSSLADLKSKAPYPEVVEPWDTNASDPELLIHFKCMPNTVPVPIHWAQNGKYLQSQRGKVRKPYKLPDYIEATGISRIRLIELPVHISLQQKTRRRMRPKLGRTDIDYQILYDAFFKYQTKKRLTKLGEVYYEGKETDKRMSKFRPGKLSRNLRNALGISSSTIPPFVQNMQRYGPPPAYPFLKIPGVNIPDDDASAMATPGLWEEPDFRYTKEFIWNFDTDKSHWYHYNKDDMIEEENNNDDEEKDLDDMGNDQDDLEISDEEKPDISGLFIKQDNKPLLEEDLKKEKNSEEKVIKEENTKEELNKDKDKEEDINKEDNKEEEKFYKVIEQEKVDLKNNELNPVAFKYNISGINQNKKDKDIEAKINKEKVEEEEEEEEEDEQDIEKINKNIFD